MKDSFLLDDLKKILSFHEEKMYKSFSLVPSENCLSPLSKLLLTSDLYSRYFFEIDKLWGDWAFPNGRCIGEVQDDIVIPIIKELAGSHYVNVRAISGLNNMLLILSSLTKSGDNILCLSPGLGGHICTEKVSERLNLNVDFILAKDVFEFDEEDLSIKLKQKNFSLIYIDQANVLFPLDVLKIKTVVNDVDADIKIHVDSSHINGLIFGKALPNPLDLGADSLGGSFHKTFPGPHKGFVSTNNKEIYDKIGETSEYLISHHHGGDILALAVSLIEFKFYGGKDYAIQTVKNAKMFARLLSQAGFDVVGKDKDFTETHQVWILNDDKLKSSSASKKLYEVGLITNSFGELPNYVQGGLRVGLNEVTKLGLKETDIVKLANIFIRVLNGESVALLKKEVSELRQVFNKPAYCVEYESSPLKDLLSIIV